MSVAIMHTGNNGLYILGFHKSNMTHAKSITLNLSVAMTSCIERYNRSMRKSGHHVACTCNHLHSPVEVMAFFLAGHVWRDGNQIRFNIAALQLDSFEACSCLFQTGSRHSKSRFEPALQSCQFRTEGNSCCLCWPIPYD